MNKGKIFIVTGFFMLLTFNLFAQADENKMPTLSSNQLWISSVPIGLDVYVAILDRSKINPEKIKEDNYVKLCDRDKQKFYLDDQKYYKGKTPLLLDNVVEGEYLIAYGPVEFWSRDYYDPTLFKVAEVSSVPLIPENFTKLDNGTIKQEGLTVYYSKKEPNYGQSIILMNIKDFSLENMKAKYPDEINYNFDQEKLRAELIEKNILNTDMFDENDISNAFVLLSRGGKVISDSKNNSIRLIIEMTGNNQWEITTQRKK